MAETPKFEQSIRQLEKLVEDLESGDLNLEEALQRFEKGVKLSKQLHQSLEEAGRKVEKLVLDSQGEASFVPFVEESEKDIEKKPLPWKPSRGKLEDTEQDTLF